MKKSFSLILCIILALPIIAISASATVDEKNKHGVLFYQVNDGYVTITDCESDASGIIEVPQEIDNLPVTVIGEEAFAECKSIQGITLPDGIKTIENRAFAHCLALESINLPDSITYIGMDILYDTKYHKTGKNWKEPGTLYVGNHLVDSTSGYQSGKYKIWNGTKTVAADALSHCSNITEVIIPNSVVSIGQGAFEGCEALEKIEIPESVTYIGADAFALCKSLKSIKLPKNITAIQERTFIHCWKLESVSLPSGLKTIGNSAFYNCSVLKEIKIPSTVTEIGPAAFTVCSSLKSISIPEGVKKIEDNTFSLCSSLEEIVIPKKVSSIGKRAFGQCEKLKKITIPKSVKTIGKYAFEECEKLTTVNYKGTKADKEKISISEDNYYLLTAIWKCKNDPDEEKAQENSSKNTVTKKPEAESSKVTSQETPSESSEQNEVSSPTSKPKNSTPKSGWIIWTFIAALVLGSVCGFIAFWIYSKLKSKT